MYDPLAEIRTISGFDEKLFNSLHENARNVILKKPPNKCYIYDGMPAKIQCYYNDLDRGNIPGVLIYVFDINLEHNKIREFYVEEHKVEELLNLEPWKKYMDVGSEVEDRYPENIGVNTTLKQFIEYEVVPYSIDEGWLQKSINLEHSFTYFTYF